MEPLKDTLEALKARLSGVFGSFVFVWCVAHPKVLAHVFFDSTVSGAGLSSAQAKIEAISIVLGGEGPWLIFWRPVLWTGVMILVTQVLGIGLHFVTDWVRLQKEAITRWRDVQLFLTKELQGKPAAILGLHRQEISSFTSQVHAFCAMSLSGDNNFEKERIRLGELAKKLQVSNSNVLRPFEPVIGTVTARLGEKPSSPLSLRIWYFFSNRL